jgi:Eukaryotic cobalamin-binding protein
MQTQTFNGAPRRTKSLALIALMAASLTAFTAAPASAGRVEDTSAAAAKWLSGKLEADGGVNSGFSKGSDPGASADAVVALAAAGVAPASVTSAGGKTPLDYLASIVGAKTKPNIGQLAKIALAVRATGLNPRAFGNSDLIAQISAAYNDNTGVIGDSVFTHSLAMLALARNGAAVPAKAASTLESLQSASGGWAFAGKGPADVDTTALAVQALIAVGRPANSGPAGRGLGYLHSLQNADGGFPYQSPSEFGTESNVNSTALVAQAIIAAGDQPESWAAARGNPLSYIVTLANSSGALGFQGSFNADNALATIGAIPALLRKPFGA